MAGRAAGARVGLAWRQATKSLESSPSNRVQGEIAQMIQHPFLLPFEKLPVTLPLFPLPNAVVMPGCQLPLNIFEPRYLNLVFDALGAERLVGLIQVRPGDAEGREVALYRTGTAGRIMSFNETNDGRLLIVLAGVCRFDIEEEIPTTRGYRRASVIWDRFLDDYDDSPRVACPRATLLESLRTYFAVKKLETDWSAIERLDDLQLCNVLTAVLPLGVAERQALVDEATLEDRTNKLVSLLQLEVAQSTPGSVKRH